MSRLKPCPHGYSSRAWCPECKYEPQPQHTDFEPARKVDRQVFQKPAGQSPSKYVIDEVRIQVEEPFVDVSSLSDVHPTSIPGAREFIVDITFLDAGGGDYNELRKVLMEPDCPIAWRDMQGDVNVGNRVLVNGQIIKDGTAFQDWLKDRFNYDF